MFQTFTGSSRRPRQVNLSGRNNNPFAVTQSTGSPHGSQSSAVQQAQQERKARQQERERQEASRRIQQTWREHRLRQHEHQTQRAEWDALVEGGNTDAEQIIRLLLQFAVPKRDSGDINRILEACRIFQTDHTTDLYSNSPGLAEQDAAFGSKILDVFTILIEGDIKAKIPVIVPVLQHICDSHASSLAVYSTKFFNTLVRYLQHNASAQQRLAVYRLMDTMLEKSGSRKVQAHEGFITVLPNHELISIIKTDTINIHVDSRALALALERHLQTHPSGNTQDSTWLLANYIYLYRHAKRHEKQKSSASVRTGQHDLTETDSAEANAHMKSITQLMGSIALQQDDNFTRDPGLGHGSFVQDQLETLVDQEKITGLLAHAETSEGASLGSVSASPLASYILTLIQMFPRKNDEIRMWIFLGSANSRTGNVVEKTPAIKVFWQAVKQTQIFKEASANTGSTLSLLKTSIRNATIAHNKPVLEQEWKICLLFLELFTFVLKIMDDDEFMSGGRSTSDYKSWTRKSALPLADVGELVNFLKNLAFTMYWHAGELMSGNKPAQSTNLAHYLGTHNSMLQSSSVPAQDALVVRRLQSSSINYMRGTVTGLLRMLYERDSRRRFLTDGDWLMPEVEMSGFIQAVLEEQRHKDQQNAADNEEEDEMMVDEELDDREALSLVGPRRTRYIHQVEQIRKQQQRALKKRKLEDALPRLNILENMPFFIPFNTRVQIFRQLVSSDQEIRRNGYTDPDLWRMAVMHSGRGDMGAREQILQSRSARVRREHVFEDAYDQFFTLGEGLKEPIQITFVDQFDTPEAGIDGGGVTKEFLTSVSEEAFKKGELKLFKESGQHLLYPNPVLIEEEKVILRQGGVPEASREWREQIQEILARYEFIGRIVGKCLYEGILIDVHFAPFFLVKWALTGGQGAAPNESGYRATINDLRDLDEELYKGLLDLKNYPGNVEDFSLDFTITDEISTENEPLGSIKVTSNLRPDGANTPVTNENKLVYISYVARHRLQVQPHLQTSAFLRGLGAMIQPSWLSMFNQSELQTLIGGDSSEIDVADLRKHTLYGGIYQIGDDGLEHPTVQLFWDVIRELPEGDRRQFLKYVTSTPRAPLLGFSQLRPPFSIRDSGSDQQRLPSASTCVNLLKLPIYQKKEVLREKLLYAITSGAGFDLS